MTEKQPEREPNLDPTTETERNREEAEAVDAPQSDDADPTTDEDLGGGGDLGG